MAAETRSAAPRPPAGDLLRQAWREFRSMRTALVLLFVLASASVLGSLFPQRNISPQRVAQYLSDHPGIAPLMDRIGLFDVFGSAWYMAIYVALVTALVACLVPRIRVYARILRTRPPRGGPLERYRNSATIEVAASPEQAIEATRRVLSRRRYRLAEHGPAELAGEKGFLREAGSLLFHVSFLVLLVGLAYGKGFGYRGQMTLIEGETKANAGVNYDAFTPGRFAGQGSLAPFSLRLDRFSNSFYDNLTPREYASWLVALDAGGREIGHQKVTVNHPMTVDGVRVFQSDYGYAPVVTVRSPSGEPLADGPVLTLRDPTMETSTGAIKLISLQPQVGLELFFFTGLRLAPDCPAGLQFCNDPRLVRPVLLVSAFQGDLHATRAQSVFTLDHSGGLIPVGDRPLILTPGQSGKLADGVTVSFPGLRRYTVLTLARDPGVPIVATAAVLILAGLLPSLYVTRRRMWARAEAAPGGARLRLAGLALQGKIAFVEEFQRTVAEVTGTLGRSGQPPASTTDQAGTTLDALG